MSLHSRASPRFPQFDCSIVTPIPLHFIARGTAHPWRKPVKAEHDGLDTRIMNMLIHNSC